MLLFLIVGVLLGAITVIFALQNVVAITVNFLAWQLHGSLALILMLAVISGVLISLLISIPEVIGSKLKFGSIRKQNKQLVDEIENYKRLLNEANIKLAEKNATIATQNQTPHIDPLV